MFCTCDGEVFGNVTEERKKSMNAGKLHSMHECGNAIMHEWKKE
jgi:hypothetical protein